MRLYDRPCFLGVFKAFFLYVQPSKRQPPTVTPNHTHTRPQNARYTLTQPRHTPTGKGNHKQAHDSKAHSKTARPHTTHDTTDRTITCQHICEYTAPNVAMRVEGLSQVTIISQFRQNSEKDGKRPCFVLTAPPQGYTTGAGGTDPTGLLLTKYMHHF